MAASTPLLQVTTERGWRGGERQVLLLSRGLARRGATVTVAAPRGSVLARRAAAAGLRVLPLHPTTPYHPLTLLRLLAELRRQRLLVHTHSSPSLSLATLARRWVGVAGIVHTRRVAFPVRAAGKYRSAADCYVAISQAVAAGLLAAGLDRSRLEIIPSGVDLQLLDTALPTSQLPAGGQVVGCVGQLSEEKGQAILLAAWPAVVARHPGARLVLVGDGPSAPQLRCCAARLPAGSVQLVGFQDDVPAWLRACTSYVQPSLSEGLGTSVLDAMACRLAVVASDTGGLPEVVADGETGLLVPPGDASGLATALLRLLDDPTLAAAMGRAGRLRVEQLFSADTMVERYRRLYHLLQPDR